jgi:GT2 family glycosyltransferase
VSEVDVVVVAYRSRDDLRACVEPLAVDPAIAVVVVDNDDPERSADTVRDLPLLVVEPGQNRGFGAGCNTGAARGSAPVLLFLNPDARMTPEAVKALAAAYADADVVAAGPRLSESTGELQPSVRRFPTLRSAFAESLFLHHLFPRAPWATELVWTGYDEPHAAEWLSGAVLSVRRSAFETAGGFDERFFMYCEDIDLCSRLRDGGGTVWYTPSAEATHAGGGSVPRPALVLHKARAKILYARLHEHGLRYAAFRVAFVLNELFRLPVAARDEALGARASALATSVRP